MKRLILFVGSLLTGLFIFGFLVAGVGWQEIGEPIQALSFLKALVILSVTGVFLLIGAMRWHFILRSQGCQVSFPSILKLYIAGFSLMFFSPIIPFASELFRTSTLLKLHQVEFGKGMASVVIDRIFEVTSNLSVVLMGGIIFLSMGGGVSYSIKMLGIIVFIGIWLLLISTLYIRMFQKKSIVGLFWKKGGGTQEVEKDVFEFFRLGNPVFWQGVLFSVLKSLIGLVRVWALIFFLGKGFAGLSGVAILGFYYLALLVPIPAGLGSHEALQAVGFGVLGLGAGTGAAFALLGRAIEILFASAGLIVLLQLSFRVLRNKVLRV